MAGRKPAFGETVGLTLDNRPVAMMRLILAVSALLVIYIDPAEPDRYVSLVYGALILYSAYSALVLTLSRRSSGLGAKVSEWAHWIDVAWYLLLIALSSGTNSLFFFFFFFPTLVASFRKGRRAGLRVVFTSAAGRLHVHPGLLEDARPHPDRQQQQ